MFNETEGQIILRRAKDAFEYAKSKENEALKSLALAIELTKSAREKYERLFLEEEKREMARRAATYNHCTK